MMTLEFEDEFDYLEEEKESKADKEQFAPKIKGAKEEEPPETSNELEEEKEIEEKAEIEEKKFDSKIYVIKVTTNKEDRAAELIADRVNKRKIEVYALARPHGLRGYIFLESLDRENAEEATFNLPYVKGILGKTVTYNEIKQMLEPVASEMKIEKGDIVEIISEYFKNEKAKVIRVDKAKGECVISLLAAAVPIPVTVKLDNLRVIRREEGDSD